MRAWFPVLILSVAFAAIGCGGRAIKKASPAPASACGNGQLDANEKCDPQIAQGQMGACPTSCPAPADGCGTASVSGSANDCTAECVTTAPACSMTSDGCCPSGCDSASDADCTNTCGDGTVEGGETCDGNCPTTCDDGDSCTTDAFTGSADTCSLACTHTPLTTCQGGDGCCPAGCTSANDSDCSTSSTCGNGTLDPGELCDGNCPTSCDDQNACTTDQLVGNATTCNAQCVHNQVATCQSGDGCCPPGCTFSNDNDCACTPTTCQDVGWTCGMLDDGCGSMRNCGSCNQGQMCSNGSCVTTPPDKSIGSACTSDTDCASGSYCFTEAVSGFPGGYCTDTCNAFLTGCTGGVGVCDGLKCAKGCTTDSDCRPGYQCYQRVGSSVKACEPIGTGSGAIGDPCAKFADCGGGQNGFCAQPADGYYNGYCSKHCDSTHTCPSGSQCSFFGGGTTGLCEKNCTSNTDCRGSGYMCYDDDNNGTKGCWVAGTGSGGIGATCTTSADCGGGQWGRCGTSANGFPGGYCSLACSTNQGTCPSGSHCGTSIITGYCIDDCTTNTDCRSSYTCQADGTAMACWP